MITSYKIFKKEYVLINRIQYFFEILVHFVKPSHYFLHKGIAQHFFDILFAGYIQFRYFVDLFQISRFEFNNVLVVKGVQMGNTKIVFYVFD